MNKTYLLLVAEIIIAKLLPEQLIKLKVQIVFFIKIILKIWNEQ